MFSPLKIAGKLRKAVVPKHLSLAAAIILTACQPIATAWVPEPVTNNAAALYDGKIYSFAGLGVGKIWRDVHAKAYACSIETGLRNAPASAR